MTDRQLLELLVEKVTGIETDVSILKLRLDGLECMVNTVQSMFYRVEGKVEGIFEQTDGLLTFRTEMKSSTKEIHENQQVLSGITGEHEMYIRRMRQRSV